MHCAFYSHKRSFHPHLDCFTAPASPDKSSKTTAASSLLPKRGHAPAYSWKILLWASNSGLSAWPGGGVPVERKVKQIGLKGLDMRLAGTLS
eukprot:1156725-Pelagomonas_calceolata.AAC.3